MLTPKIFLEKSSIQIEFMLWLQENSLCFVDKELGKQA
ncbi:hypothetical protein RV13_GL003310 [Enterococcus raffinosus]|nr:hypothetical protein RV13_GL003310 [Enterococcus raffinosus]